MTGIELAGQLRRIGIEAPVVFLTTSREHAPEAFGVGAAGYSGQALRAQGAFQGAGCRDIAKRERAPEKRLLKVDGEVRSVAVQDILYREARRNYQHVSLANGSDIRLRMTTGELFALLAPSGSFARCGAAYILNLAKLRRLNPKSALMAGGAEIPVPRGAYAGLKTAYYDYYSER